MNRINVVAIVMLALWPTANVAHGAEAKQRTAKVTDTAGVSTEVREMDIPFNSWRYGHRNEYAGRKYITIETSEMEMAIPVDLVVSLERAGTVVITYVVGDSHRKVSGKLLSERLEGKTDFGNFNLETSKLASITFADPPVKHGKSPEPDSLAATITLVHGKNLTVKNVLRYTTYYSNGWLLGGRERTRVQSSPNFVLRRGESNIKWGLDN